MSSSSNSSSPESQASPIPPPAAQARAPSDKRTRTKRLGGVLSLLGGVGFLVALFLPWLDYLDISEDNCFISGCNPSPDIPNVSGLDLLANTKIFFFLVLPLFFLTVVAALGIGLLRGLSPRRTFARPWLALWLPMLSLIAFALLLIVPPPAGTYIEYPRIVGEHLKPGALLALVALFTALLGGIIQFELNPRPSVPAAVSASDERQLQFNPPRPYPAAPSPSRRKRLYALVGAGVVVALLGSLMLGFGVAGLGPLAALQPTGGVTEFALPTPDSALGGITNGPDGNLWFTESQANQIGRISPTGTITEFPMPTQDSGPLGITAGPDGNLWFTEGTSNKIGRIKAGK